MIRSTSAVSARPVSLVVTSLLIVFCGAIRSTNRRRSVGQIDTRQSCVDPFQRFLGDVELIRKHHNLRSIEHQRDAAFLGNRLDDLYERLADLSFAALGDFDYGRLLCLGVLADLRELLA